MSRQPSRIADLVFGIRLAFRGARLRTALTAIGIGLAAAVLIFAAALPHAIDARGKRVDSRLFYGQDSSMPAGPTTLLAAGVGSTWRGKTVGGVFLQPEGDSPARPPGVQRVPGPGELVVSPALARLLDDPDAGLLRERIGGRVIAQISKPGLAGPGELLWYKRTKALNATDTTSGRVYRINGFRPPPTYENSLGISESTYLSLLVLVGCVALLIPIAILVATAARFGGERRDRRLAALRLVGCTQHRTAWIAAGESAAGALLGLVLGGAIFIAARAVIERISVFGINLFASDVTPNPWLVALVAAGIVGVTIAASLAGLRRVAIEPLSVTRRGAAQRPRRLWWRPVPFVLGFALLAEFIFGGSIRLPDDRVRVALGAVLVLGSIAALLPWAVEAAVRRMRPWSVSSQLAIRALQQDPSGASRIVGGLAVAVAAAITLQTLLTLTESRDRVPAGAPARVTATMAASSVGNLEDLGRLRADVVAIRGVERSTVTGSLQMYAPRLGQWSTSTFTIGTCADLALLGAGPDCRDALSMYRMTQRTAARGTTERILVPRSGDRIKVSDSEASGWTAIRLPETLPTLPSSASITDSPYTGILSTVGAIESRAPRVPKMQLEASVWLDPTDPLAAERFNNAIARFDPLAYTYDRSTYANGEILTKLRRALLAGAALLVLLTGASLLVTTLEQLGERRRTLATLAATGTPRSVLRRALWLRVGIPVAIGLALAIGVGMALGATLLAMQHETVRFDPSGMVRVLALAVGLIAGVTALSLPLLRRVSAPSAMRTE